MTSKTFSASLTETFPITPDAEDLAAIQKRPAELLDWVLARVLLGEDVPEQAVAWFEAQVDRYESKRRREPFSQVTGLSSLAATALLLGRSADEHAERAADAILPASKKTDSEVDVVELTSCAIALNMYYGYDKGLRAWRKARYEQRLPDDTAPSAFHMLFMSEPDAAREPLDRLTLETAHVAFLVLTRLTHQFAAPLVLALEARAAEHEKAARELLRGAAGRLDEALFGPARDPDARLVIHDPVFDVGRGDGAAVLRAVVAVQGRGRLQVGPELVLPLTAEFTGNLVDFIDSTIDRATAKRLAAVVTKPQGVIRGVLSYDSSAVAVEQADQRALEARFGVAFAHAKQVIEGLRCSGELVFEDTAAKTSTGGSARRS
jgi:hypothetical protein